MEVEYGIGQSLTVTNVGTGAEFTTDTDPVVTETTFHADGSRSVVAAGSNLIVLFPTDVPGGPIAEAPSMTLVEGVAVYTISTGEVWTIQQVYGSTTDVWAEIG